MTRIRYRQQLSNLIMLFQLHSKQRLADDIFHAIHRFGVLNYSPIVALFYIYPTSIYSRIAFQKYKMTSTDPTSILQKTISEAVTSSSNTFCE